MTDWFERLTGFPEGRYADVQARLEVQGERLHSRVNGASYAIGSLELVSLADLRARCAPPPAGAAPALRVRTVSGNVGALHQQRAYAGALFQVASQFNLLEMVGSSVTPEDGVTRYASDFTQGPACAMAAGAATLYRNYCVPVGDGFGQTRHRQLDGLADLGAALAHRLGCTQADLWHMSNGYALATQSGLQAINALLATCSAAERDALRGLLRIGVHRDVEVTDGPVRPGPLVSQAFCSAVPVAYSRLPAPLWQPLACLVLEAAYEATLLAAACNAQRGASPVVLLTRLGGGAFGNVDDWIDQAIWRALRTLQHHPLQVWLVSRHAPDAASLAMARTFA